MHEEDRVAEDEVVVIVAMIFCRSKSPPVVLEGDKGPDDEEDGVIVVAIARIDAEHEEAKRGEEV